MSSPLGTVPAGIDLNATHTLSTIISVAVLVFLGVGSVILRIVARRYTPMVDGLAIDDYFLVVALVSNPPDTEVFFFLSQPLAAAIPTKVIELTYEFPFEDIRHRKWCLLYCHSSIRRWKTHLGTLPNRHCHHFPDNMGLF